jgi:predicted glycosyltransferase involved in capsule biosynthesis
MISFCTTCMGWLAYLHYTLPTNLEVLGSFHSKAELVLLDYNSPDGLEEWVFANFQPHLDSGLLKFYKTDKPAYFCRTHAKNVVHKFSNGEYVCNLDADNFLSDPYVRLLFDLFEEYDDAIAYGSDSAQGRIALKKEYFVALGGYNEDFKAWGVEDVDLILRSSLKFQLRGVDLSELCLFIEHGHDERVKNQKNKDLLEAREESAVIAKELLKNKQYIANTGREWGVL